MLNGRAIPVSSGNNCVKVISIYLIRKMFLVFQAIYYQLTRKSYAYLADSQYSALLTAFVTQWTSVGL